MTIDKAIKRNEKLLRATGQREGMKEYDAIKLGIEALRRIKLQHRETFTIIDSPLPGETKD